jgi:hypothetical protein
MFVGYAQVSTRDQDLVPRLDALSREGCEKIFMEKAKGAARAPQLAEALNYARRRHTDHLEARPAGALAQTTDAQYIRLGRWEQVYLSYRSDLVTSFTASQIEHWLFARSKSVVRLRVFVIRLI